MCCALAYAESAGPDDQNVWFVLVAVGILAAAALLVCVPIAFARIRRHRYTEVISAASIFWALLAAGSVIYFTIQRTKWSHEYTLRLQSGYGNPDDLSGAPQTPWLLWSAMIVAYIALIVWSQLPRSRANMPQS